MKNYKKYLTNILNFIIKLINMLYHEIPKFKTNVGLEELKVIKMLNPQYYAAWEGWYWHYFSVIKMNNTYMDVSTYHYQKKGHPTAMIIYMMIFVLFIACLPIYMRFFEGADTGILHIILGITLMSPLFCLVYFGKYKWDNKIFTHYPVRFNRKTRKVYFLDLEGNYQVGDFDRMKFYITQFSPFTHDYEINGVILDDEGKVQHTTDIGASLLNLEGVEAFWRFIAIYMTEGPEPLYPYYYEGMENSETAMMYKLTFCNDIDEKQESKEFGNYRLSMNVYGAPVFYIFRHFFLEIQLWRIGRRYAMNNCTVPKWPEWIKEENVIEPDDPYVVDASINNYYRYHVVPHYIELLEVPPAHMLEENKPIKEKPKKKKKKGKRNEVSE